jgi:hypothetical protein
MTCLHATFDSACWSGKFEGVIYFITVHGYNIKKSKVQGPTYSFQIDLSSIHNDLFTIPSV